MLEKYASMKQSKAESLADSINSILQQISIRCCKGSEIFDYYHVGIIGYGEDGVNHAFAGNLAGRTLVPISEMANNPVRIEDRIKHVSDGAGGLVDVLIKSPVWIDPVAGGGTPMTKAFVQANEIIARWIKEHPGCFPPVVVHVTDGESNDGDPEEEMKKLAEQSSNDGNVILFNLHTHANPTNPILFPGPEIPLPDKYARMLFNGASLLPTFMKRTAENEYGIDLSQEARAFVLNGGIDVIIMALNIGTRPRIGRGEEEQTQNLSANR
jgi:hypothetical protein